MGKPSSDPRVEAIICDDNDCVHTQELGCVHEGVVAFAVDPPARVHDQAAMRAAMLCPMRVWIIDAMDKTACRKRAMCSDTSLRPTQYASGAAYSIPCTKSK
eukprot:CAMPEP_0185565708 /NCGR_PEP_ID=MMETSP1381-20130426/65744_1 /TAXON_ID=298111 /ORGANISM="Pavlova sp., Strain CCMP459" /LENGTH=101 /DNA_ID=CAMNT_0028179653 /DNA_START=797 /DNA_END=1100 /DNA_ORIENTATION=-